MTVSVASSDIRMPYGVAIKHSTLSTTQCCKMATFNTGISSLYTLASTVADQSALTLSLSAYPTYNLTLSLVLYNTRTGSTDPAVVGTLTPNKVSLYPSYTPNTLIPVVLVAGEVGTYGINFTISGKSFDEFEIAETGSATINVLSLNSEPAAPAMISATFSADGTYVTVLFDSPTNQGGYANTFPCNAFLYFDGMATATCSWVDYKTIVIYPSYSDGAAVLTLDSPVSLYADSIQAYCTDMSTMCSNWENYAQSTTKHVVAPASPTLPSVVISGPSTVGICSSITLDLSNSVGAAGRPWMFYQVNVSDSVPNVNVTEIAKLLHSAAYTISPPTPIPNKWLIMGHSYTFTATFCNFLGACGTATKAVEVSTSALTPVVSIAGLTTRTITTWTQLLVTAVAYTQTCNGGTSANNLRYEWTIYETGVSDVLKSFTSTSQNPAAFKLNAYTLTVGSTYRVQVAVTSTLVENPTPVKASVYVIVAASSLVAKISGGSSRSVQIRQNYTIDASTSYDQDALPGTASSLTYSWSCYQTLPSYSAACPVFLAAGSSASKKIVTTNGGVAGNVARVTVTVSDATRSASTYMDITLTQNPSSVVTIASSLSSLTSVNVNQQITLTGSLSIVSACTATWAVDDTSLRLSDFVLTPVTTSLTSVQPAINTVALLIPGGSLPQRATLGFSLSCGSVTSVLSMTTNGSPLPGVFKITPRSGIQIATPFAFTASLWIDPDLPLSYQFGFISPTSGALLVFQGKSENSYATTKLPGGPATSNHMIFGTLQVYDVFGAATSNQLNVTVTAGTNTTQQNSGLHDLIQSNSGSVDDTNAVIATVGTVLNAVNCTVPTPCATLKRAECSSVAHTCGVCLTGYLGVSGAGNTACMTLAQYTNNGGRRRLTVGATCTSNAGCNAGNWETCKSGKCVQDSKTCPNDCSGNGQCKYFSASTGASAGDYCGVSDASCISQCICDTNYGGSSCSMTLADLNQRLAFRSALVQSLDNVTKIDDVNEVSIVRWANALSSLSLNSEELSVDDAEVVHRIANLTIAYAKQMGTTDYSSLIGLLNSLDSATSVIAADARRRRLSGRSLEGHASRQSDILTTAGAFGDVVKNGMAQDQTSTVYMMNNFRLSTQINTANAGSNVGISGPQSDLEYYSGTMANYINIEPSNSASGTLGSSMVIADATAYASLDGLISNPMQFRVDSAAELKTVTFTIVNNAAQSQYGSAYKHENFTLECTTEVYNRTHICKDSGTKLTQYCTGIAGTKVTWCPRPAPQCSFVDSATMTVGEATGCRVIDNPINTEYTTCECTVQAHRRQLTTFTNVLSQTGVTNMVTTSTYIASTFASTFAASKDFTKPADAQKVLIVILLFAILWAVGLLSLVGLCFKRQKRIQKTSIEKRRSHKAGSSTHTTVDIRKYLLAYVDKLIPDVYHATKSKIERAADETRKHHRYLQLFTAREDQIDVNKRILTLTKMLTVQTMLMFLLAVLYDLQGPDDDGSCPGHVTKSTCLHRKSILDSTQTYCHWGLDKNVGYDTCTYQAPMFTAKIMIYIILLTSLFTSIFNTPIDKLFDTLEAPTGDSVGESRLVKATKAAVSGARRASVAAMNATSAAVNTAKSRLSRVTVLKNLGLAHDEDKALANRRIPEDVTFAHTLAYMALPEISAQAQVTHLRQSVVNNEIRNVAAKRMTQIRGTDMNKSLKKAGETREAEGTTGPNPAKKLAITSDDMVDQLLEEIMQQRLILPSNSEETNNFDTQWGIEKNSVTSPDGKTISTSLYINGHSLRGMSKDVATSDAKAKDLKQKMEFFSDNQAGLDILHFFMVDLLGRHTLAAKIFENKFEEDFERTQVVSKYTKWGVLLCILAMNGFFMYYALLKGYTKGIHWQNQYLQGCITQLFIEIFLFESMECVWINYWVPDLVSGEVMRAGVILRESAEKISLADRASDNEIVNAKYFLDAPTYLFVSTKLAKKFPNLLESIIVSGYRNHLPGEISRTWRNEHTAAENTETVRNSFQGKKTLGNIIFACVVAISSGLSVAMQALGSLPYFYQRIIIRFVQPVFLSGLTILWYFAVRNPIYVAVIVAGTACVIFVLYVRYKNRENNSNRPAKVAPIQSPGVKMGLVLNNSDRGESKVNNGESKVQESKNAESKMNEMSGRPIDPLNKKASFAGSSLSEEGERIVPLNNAAQAKRLAPHDEDSDDSAKDSG